MSRKTVLLVDETSAVLLMEMFVFKNSPYEILAARNADDAARVIAEKRPHIVVASDAMARAIATRLTLEAPLLRVCDRGQSGGDDAVVKPLNAAELLAKVHSLLGRNAFLEEVAS